VHEYPCWEEPWVLHSDGTFVTSDYDFHRRLPFPDNTKFISANGSWLVLYRTDNARRSYLLHNPFTKATVPLPGLDSLVGYFDGWFKILKVLMRSDQDDIVAVTTNSEMCPIILCRPGKPGAWFPEEEDEAYASIHAGNLYGITKSEELVLLGLDEDEDGTPIVTSVGWVIENLPDEDVANEEEAYEYDGDALSDEDTYSNEEEEEAYYDEAPSSLDAGDDGHEDVSSNGDEGDTSYGLNCSNKYEDNGDNFKYCEGDALIPYPFYKWELGEYITSRHLIESNGKLIMLRRLGSTQHSSGRHTSDVEVLEADLGAGEWAPTDVTGTFYVSGCHSKYVPVLSDEDEDKLAWYFADEHNIMDPQSQTSYGWSMSTWLFPHELVV
jgi:hypothetical protein